MTYMNKLTVEIKGGTELVIYLENKELYSWGIRISLCPYLMV